MIQQFGRNVRRALAVILLSALPVFAAEPSARLLADNAFAGTLISGIRQANKRIICAYYLFKIGAGPRNLPAAVARELAAARRRGVDVTVMLEEKKPVGGNNRDVALFLARSGVKVLFPSRRAALHLKAMVVDDRYVIVGSHNITQAALTRNSELSLLVDNPKLAEEVRRYLESLAGGSAYLIAP